MNIDPKTPISIEIKKSKLESIGIVIRFMIRSLFVFLIIVMLFGISMGSQGFLPQKVSSYEKHYINWYGQTLNKKISTLNQEKTEEDVVLIISINGMIANKGMEMLEGTMSEDVLSILDIALEDSSIKAIILKINSPGGTVIDSEKIAQKVQEVKTVKPVYAILESIATSGGYYIASQASKIFAYNETLTGSIGVIMQIPNVADLMDKIGVKMYSMTSGPMKSMGSPYEEMTPEKREIFQALIDESYEGFLDRVSSGRNMEYKTVKEIADGRILSGKQAEKLGLIDSTGGIEAVKNELDLDNLGHLELIEFKLPKTPLEELLMPLGKTALSYFKTPDASARLYYK